MKHWIYLAVAVAIVSEIVATSALAASQGFTRPWPTLLPIVGYGLAFYFLSLTLNSIPVGVAYAIWSGVGTVLITLVGWLMFDQKLDLAALAGIGPIAAGVVVMNVFSTSVRH